MPGRPPYQPTFTCPCGAGMYLRKEWEMHKLLCPTYQQSERKDENDRKL